MSRNPIAKVLSTIRTHDVRCLLMGGQACVLYGAAEFSLDVDLVLLPDEENLALLNAALADLAAEPIAVPPLQRSFLEAGLAVHFRCRHPEAARLRIDVMSKLRGVEPFDRLWSRRTTIETDGLSIELVSIPDLILAKKTQRAKDWPMIARLVDVHYDQHRDEPTPERIAFWLSEARTPAILIELAERFSQEACSSAAGRSLLRHAIDHDETALRIALRDEEEAEKAADREYWRPLRAELERLRLERSRED